MVENNNNMNIEIKENGEKIIRINLTLSSSTYYKILAINKELGLYSRTDAENIRNYIIASLPLMIEKFLKKWWRWDIFLLLEI